MNDTQMDYPHICAASPGDIVRQALEETYERGHAEGYGAGYVAGLAAAREALNAILLPSVNHLPDENKPGASWAMTVEDLGLSNRTLHTLLRNGICKVSDLTTRTKFEISDIHQMGQASIDDIENRLATLNLTLRGEPSNRSS